MCMFCRSLFVLLYFFFWPLCCLFFDIRILITPLVSSNSSSIITTLYTQTWFTLINGPFIVARRICKTCRNQSYYHFPKLYLLDHLRNFFDSCLFDNAEAYRIKLIHGKLATVKTVNVFAFNKTVRKTRKMEKPFNLIILGWWQLKWRSSV
jgi:hypothetical protein